MGGRNKNSGSVWVQKLGIRKIWGPEGRSTLQGKSKKGEKKKRKKSDIAPRN